MKYPAKITAYLCGLTFLISVNSNASSFFVDTTIDDATLSNCITVVLNDCSLRGATIAANGNPGVDNIDIPVGNYLLTVQGVDNTSILGDLDLTEDVNLIGAGIGNTIIDATGLGDRVFDIFGELTVSIDGLELMGGSALDGGGIRNEMATLIIENASIHDNIATDSGGGIYNESGTVDVLNTLIHNNESTNESGGGIYNEAYLNVSSDSEIYANKALSNVWPQGEGGGIANIGGEVIVSNVSIYQNEAVTGGGIYNLNGSVELDSTLVRANVANQGAGLASETRDESADLTIAYSSIKDNVADFEGAGIYNYNAMNSLGANLIIEYSTISGNYFSGNSPSETGGGIYNSSGTLGSSPGVVELNYSRVTRNSASTYGGGIYNKGCSISIKESQIDRNEALSGGGIYNLGFRQDTVALINNSSILKNRAFSSGGGIYNRLITAGVLAYVVVNNSTISHNDSAAYGAGIHNAVSFFMTPLPEVFVNHSTVTANTFANVLGAGMFSQRGLITVGDSIVAEHAGNQDCMVINSGVIRELSENLEGNTSCGFTHSGNPQLNVLANYGGNAPTRALLAASPAIDAAENFSCMVDLDGDGVVETTLANDQRGVAMINHCDLGAYEF